MKNLEFFHCLSTEPPLSFSHSPGSMFICDTTVDEYLKIHKPEHGNEQPRLITLTDQPYLASVCSVTAKTKVEELAKMVWTSLRSVDGSEDIQVASEFLKIAVRLSHAPCVVIGFLQEKKSFSSETSTSDCIRGAVALVKALQALNKKITIVTQHNAQLMQDSITANADLGQVSKDGVRVIECGEGCDMKEIIFQGEIRHRLDTMIAFQLARENAKEDCGLVDRFFQEGIQISALNNINMTTCRYIFSIVVGVTCTGLAFYPGVVVIP